MMGEWNEEAIDTIIDTLEPEKVEQEPYIPPYPRTLTTMGLLSMCGWEGWIYLGSMYRWEG